MEGKEIAAERFLEKSKNIDYSKIIHINDLMDVRPFIEADLIEFSNEQNATLQSELEEAKEVLLSLSKLVKDAGHDLWLEHSGVTTFLEGSGLTK